MPIGFGMRKNIFIPPHFQGGAPVNFGWVLEDGLGFWQLEDGLGYFLLEDAS